jgi:transcriptional regulator with XRE-family HTH domain
VSEVEIGHRNLSYKNLLRIAKGLGVPLSEWIALAERLSDVR